MFQLNLLNIRKSPVSFLAYYIRIKGTSMKQADKEIRGTTFC